MKQDEFDSSISGIVTDFQRFSLHDGPGIRESIFLKGCNMNCAWCHNPETIYPEIEEIYKPENCIHCGKCAEGCFSGARTTVGRKMSVEDVFLEIEEELPYFGEDGGITISGGEPAFQSDFTVSILKKARSMGINTAVETNMSFPEEICRKIWSNADLILADIKLADPELHRKWTGIGNERIIHNIRTCASEGVPIIIHTPVICGVNDSEKEIGAIADICASLPSLKFYELLPYHPLGLSKGELSHVEPRQRFEKPDKESLHRFAETARSKGIHVRIAGNENS